LIKIFRKLAPLLKKIIEEKMITQQNNRNKSSLPHLFTLWKILSYTYLNSSIFSATFA